MQKISLLRVKAQRVVTERLRPILVRFSRSGHRQHGTATLGVRRRAIGLSDEIGPRIGCLNTCY